MLLVTIVVNHVTQEEVLIAKVALQPRIKENYLQVYHLHVFVKQDIMMTELLQCNVQLVIILVYRAI